jgi:hypothetical protein
MYVTPQRAIRKKEKNHGIEESDQEAQEVEKDPTDQAAVRQFQQSPVDRGRSSSNLQGCRQRMKALCKSSALWPESHAQFNSHGQPAIRRVPAAGPALWNSRVWCVRGGGDTAAQESD